MWTCKFFARNQQKHHLAVESWSFKEAATFGSRSTEEFCATRGILRAPFTTVLDDFTIHISYDIPYLCDSSDTFDVQHRQF